MEKTSFLSNPVFVAVPIIVITVFSFIWYRSLNSMGSTPSKSPANNASATSKAHEKDKKPDSAEDAKAKYPAGKLTIYFGSQTGTAEGFSRVLMEEGKSNGFDAKMSDLEDFDAHELASSNIAIFLMATYGEGEPTDNAAAFYKWAKNEDNDVDNTFLSSLKFSVFGLGNRQYEHFNRMGKLSNEFLEKLGGQRVFDYGEGDDDGSLEEDFEQWKEKLWPSLISQFHPNQLLSQSTSSKDNEKRIDLAFHAKIVSEDAASSAPAIRTNQMSSSTKHFFTSTLVNFSVNRELRNHTNKGPEEVGSTRHIEIDINGTSLSYCTADNLAILPENNPLKVEKLARVLGYQLSDTFVVEPLESSFKYPFPSPCTVSDVLTKYLDIQGMPKFSTVSQLLPYVTDATQKAWLARLLRKENRAEFKSFIEDNARSICDLLIEELSSCAIPLSDFLHIAPFIQPRYYTISSSSSCFPKSIHITVSLTEYNLATGRPFTGLCSGFIKSLGDRACKVFVKPSTFRLPKSLSTPITMVGPGTGIAPMRALLQDRSFQQRKAAGAVAPRNTLYFGCKYRDVDFIYSDELEEYRQDGTLTDLHLAFSRDQQKKVYVQHLISEESNACSLMADINGGGFVFVCGATSMGSDVYEAIVSVVEKEKALSKAAAVEFVKKLQSTGRYVQELWS